MSKIVEILSLLDRNAKSLTQLSLSVPIPLLPVANKPIVEHLLEAVAAHAPTRLVVRVAGGDASTEAHVLNMAWPDMEIFVEGEGSTFVDRPTLTVRGDVLPSPLEIGAAIEEVRQTGALRGDFTRFGISWLEAGERVPGWSAPERRDSGRDRFIPDLIAYHRVALAAAKGEILGLNPGGWLEHDGVRTSVGAQVRTRRAAGRNAEIGPYAFVDTHVILGDNVLLGERSYVARGARLEEAVILPHTYVGAGVNLSNAVVGGNWVFHVDSGLVDYVQDSRILSSLVA